MPRARRLERVHHPQVAVLAVAASRVEGNEPTTMGPDRNPVARLAIGQERDAARVEVVAKELHGFAAAGRVLPEDDMASAGRVQRTAGDPSRKNVSCVRAPPGLVTSCICVTFPNAVVIAGDVRWGASRGAGPAETGRTARQPRRSTSGSAAGRRPSPGGYGKTTFPARERTRAAGESAQRADSSAWEQPEGSGQSWGKPSHYSANSRASRSSNTPTRAGRPGGGRLCTAVHASARFCELLQASARSWS